MGSFLLEGGRRTEGIKGGDGERAGRAEVALVQAPVCEAVHCVHVCG